MSNLAGRADVTIGRLADAAASAGGAHERFMVTGALEEVGGKQKVVAAQAKDLETARSRLQREVWSGHEVLNGLRKAIASCGHDADVLAGLSSDNMAKAEGAAAEGLVKQEKERLGAWERALSAALDKAWRAFTSTRPVSKEEAAKALTAAASLLGPRSTVPPAGVAPEGPGGLTFPGGGAFKTLVGPGWRGDVR